MKNKIFKLPFYLLYLLVGFSLTSCVLKINLNNNSSTSTTTSESPITTTTSSSDINVEYFSLSEKEVNIYVNKTYQIYVDLYDEENLKYLSFKSEDENIASVDNSGLIRGLLKGETIISVECLGQYETINVNVLEDFSNVDLKINLLDNIDNQIQVDSSYEIDVEISNYSNLDEVEISILEGNSNAFIDNRQLTATHNGSVSIQANIKNEVFSNVLNLSIYDIKLIGNSNSVNVNDYISFDYNFSNENDITPHIKDNNIISIGFSPFGNRIYVNGLQAGKTSFYLSNDVDQTITNTIEIVVEESVSYENISKDEFYSNYKRATSYDDALLRSEYGLMSGDIYKQDQEPTVANYQPTYNGKLIHNSDSYYSENENAYTVVDSYGNDAFTVYRGGGGYVTLEDVAAYVYAFGDVPANYNEDKYDDNPKDSIWGEYLRLNNSYYRGDPSSYPYEPILPETYNINGNLKYYEIDIGTTGTDCDPNYEVAEYNNGYDIVRGAARIVYTRYYGNNSLIEDLNDRYVFYTYNHYNDFQEYLNYENGWGEIFGNITGGGTISSRDPNKCNPTPYIETIRMSLISVQN